MWILFKMIKRKKYPHFSDISGCKNQQTSYDDKQSTCYENNDSTNYIDKKYPQKYQKYPQKNGVFYTCKICDYNTSRKTDFQRHIDSKSCMCKKYPQKYQKYPQKKKTHICETCNYESTITSNYRKHLQTKKHHKNVEMRKQKENDVHLSSEKNSTYVSEKSDSSNSNDVVKVLIEQNQALQDKLLEMASQPKIVVNNNTQSNNQKNNIVQFLNNDCKDAVNLSDFISQLVVTFDDLETIENEGYVTSIKETLIKSLGDMKKETRPIHCTDVKRKQFYVKDNDKWEKEKNTNSKIYSALNDYNNKQVLTMQEWKSQNPGWAVIEEKQDKINRLTREVTSLSMIQNKLIQEIGEMTKICL